MVPLLKAKGHKVSRQPLRAASRREQSKRIKRAERELPFWSVRIKRFLIIGRRKEKDDPIEKPTRGLRPIQINKLTPPLPPHIGTESCLCLWMQFVYEWFNLTTCAHKIWIIYKDTNDGQLQLEVDNLESLTTTCLFCRHIWQNLIYWRKAQRPDKLIICKGELTWNED